MLCVFVPISTIRAPARSLADVNASSDPDNACLPSRDHAGATPIAHLEDHATQAPIEVETFEPEALLQVGIAEVSVVGKLRNRAERPGVDNAPIAGMGANDRAAAGADKESSDGDLVSATADSVASGRDEAAADRELISTARDSAATARDRAAEELERADGPGGPEYKAAVKHAAKVRADAAADRKQAATDRKQAAFDRAEAAIDRGRASRDRQHASIDREHAAVDRRQALDELELAHTDGLTGAYGRGAGQAVLQQEVNRSERTGENLVLAFVDLDGLKRTNDIQGHAAGDARLCAVFDAMRSKLRTYDPIVRHGGDELLCSVAGVSTPDVKQRFDEIEVMLSSGENSGSVSVGLAELGAGDSLADLINRADEAMIRTRSTKIPGRR